MTPTIPARARSNREFRTGDKVVLAEGTYQGTLGVFLELREDANWADIQELNGSVRSHPVRWLAKQTEELSHAESSAKTVVTQKEHAP
jgi:hypothetical protein